MPENAVKPFRSVLDPVSRFSEILFGLIMALTFTGSISVAEAGREEVRTVLIGALGCNLAWGLVDAIMYLTAIYTERGRGLSVIRAVRKATDPAEAYGHIAEALPPVVASLLQRTELEAIRRQVNQLPEPLDRPALRRKDYLGAIAVFLLVFLSTFPLVIPFLFIQNVLLALRISNGIALALLFAAGYQLGQHAGRRPWRMGLVMVIIGVVLVAITVILGG